MSQTGVYLYGFVPLDPELDFSGIDGIDDGGAIRSLCVGASSAVVGEVRIDAFQAALSSGVDGGPDPAWVIPRALRHQAILEAVLARSPVLPARFGTLFSSSEALKGLATTHQDDICHFFETLGNRLEWSLRGYHEPDRATEALLATDPEFSSRFPNLPTAPGTRYFLEKKLREEARRSARQAARRAAETIRETLRKLTDDVRSLPLRGVEAPGREMILHETFLISPTTADEALKALESGTTSGLLTLEPSGPWPPFHFCPELGRLAE